MSNDYRLNWILPAEPLGPAIQTAPITSRDSVREFETMTDAEPNLPEGIWETSGGDFGAQCVVCERWTSLFCGVDEVPATGYRHYCGGSPRCCP